MLDANPIATGAEDLLRPLVGDLLAQLLMEAIAILQTATLACKNTFFFNLVCKFSFQVWLPSFFRLKFTIL
jgi:hypothetical protein